MKRVSLSTLDRKQGEGDRDYVQRLLFDPMLAGATDAEVSEHAGLSPSKIREERQRILCWDRAVNVAASVGYDGDLHVMLMDMLTMYELAACAEGRCRHALCLRGRTHLEVLAAQGVTLRIVDGDKFVSDPRSIPDDVRAFIVANRAAIVAALMPIP